MLFENLLNNTVLTLTKLLFSVKENKSRNIGTPNKIIVIRQHNQFGDLLASISLFRAIKETYPKSEVTVILSPANYYGIEGSQFIDKSFVFDKKKIYNFGYFRQLFKLLRNNYDLAIVPATVSLSSTSCILGRLAKAKIRIGPNSLEGKTNKFNFMFDRRVDLNWSLKPDRHVADFGLDIVRPFGITTNNLRSQIDYSEINIAEAKDFVDRLLPSPKNYIVGIHIGAGKPPNRWAIENFVKLITRLDRNYNIKFYFTGSSSDKEQFDELEQKLSINAGYLMNKPIPLLAAVIESSNLFITNDTGVMHVAGATKVDQVSIFGPTNPKNWAPLGTNKSFLQKNNVINNITVSDVYDECVKFLN